jgi:16S rRNA processing protein RimM
LRRRRPEALIGLGHAAGAYGVRGWIKVAGDRATLAALAAWWLDGAERRVEQTKMHSAWLLAKLAGIETREQAQALKGKAIAVPRAALPEPADGIYYWADLVGLEVVNLQGLVLGVVKGMVSSGAQDVMELTGAQRTRLLPWVPAIVKRVDLEARRIEVDWGADW